jgi:replicative DNA helicase
MGVKDIDTMIQREADRTGWIPEIIVLDYAELLAKHPNAKDEIESTNLNWRDLRAMSTNWHCLVLTASQTNASGYGSWVIGREQFSGSKAKLAHATAIIGISITELERTNQVCRFNFVVQREAEYMSDLPGRMVAVAGCPRIGRMHLASAWV